jgi:hypothetical protein
MANRKLGHRISVNLDQKTFQDLSAIAQANDVSVSWLARYAVNELVALQRAGRVVQLPLTLKEARNASDRNARA